MSVQQNLIIFLSKKKMYGMSVGIVVCFLPGGLALVRGLTSRTATAFEVSVIGTLLATGAYFAIAMIVQTRRPILVLKDDGFVYYPPLWPLTRPKEGRFVSWEGVNRVHFTHVKCSVGMDLYTQDPARSESARRRLRPDIQIPVSFLTVSKKRLAREMDERAYRHGVVLY